MIRSHRYKLIKRYACDQYELFDLHPDPCEIFNLSSDPKHQSLTGQLTAQITAFFRTHEDPI